MFKAFERLDDDANSHLNSDGIGLGLTICQALVVQNGGKIQVYSDGSGKGTTFEFDFKLEQSEDNYNYDLTQRDQYNK